MAINFGTWLVGSHEGRADWLDWFPLKDEVETGIDDRPDAVSFVDVGGSQGSELKRLHDKYPNLPGCLVLQDVESVIEDIPAGEPFEATIHVFFTPQPIKGTFILLSITFSPTNSLHRRACLLLSQCAPRLV